MENLEFYNKLRKCPAEAKKTIAAGRLKGFTDINPQFRIMKMTETFGPVGIGWYYTIDKQWTETFGSEVKCFTNVSLYIKDGDGWSAPIQGTGGSSLVSQERSGAYVSDEGHKMALTDALSVAMKALGIAADVYFEKGALYGTKYEVPTLPQAQSSAPKTATPESADNVTLETLKRIIAEAKTEKELVNIYHLTPQPLMAQVRPLLSARKEAINAK